MIPTDFARLAPHGVLEYVIKYVCSSSVMIINKESSEDYSVCECRMCVECDSCGINGNGWKCIYSNYSIEASSYRQRGRYLMHIRATCTIYNTTSIAGTVAAAEALVHNWILRRASGVDEFSAWYIINYRICCTLEDPHGVLHCELNNGILNTYAENLQVECSAVDIINKLHWIPGAGELHTITLSNNTTVVLEPLFQGVVLLHDYDAALNQYITAHCTDTSNYPPCVYDAYSAFCSEIVRAVI